MKRLVLIFSVIFTASNAAADFSDQFFFKPFLTLEYQAPRLSGGGRGFKTDGLGSQILRFENISPGVSMRIHRYIGIDASYVMVGLNSAQLNRNDQALDLEGKASFNFKAFTLSTLFYLSPTENGPLELFGEVGAALIDSTFKYRLTDGTGVNKGYKQANPLVGAGFQFMPFSGSNDAFRFSYQHYLQKMEGIDANYGAFRVGFIKSF